MATIGSLVVNIGANVGGLTQGLQSAQQNLRNFGQSMGSMGRSLSLGVTAPLVGIGVVALQSAADFEQSMNLLQATSGATAAQMEALQAQALELGASTSFSAGEAAGAMLELAKAGMSVEETSAAIGGVMDLAAAGGIGLAEAATITANAINAFGLEASEATNVANTFAAAANASSADVGELAAGFQMAGAVFAANNQTVETLAASLAILANNGIAGSDAGTSLKTMLMRLAAPTAEASAEIANLGLQIYDSTGAMLPFGDIVAQLETATAGMSDAQRNAALSTIFGADAIRAATILAGEGATGFAEMEKAVSAQGAAQEMSAARMQGVSGAIEYLKGSIDSLLIGGALPFMDMLSDWIRYGADLITQFGTLSPEVQKWGVIIGVAAAAAGPLLMILGAMASGLAALMSPITLVIAGVALLAAAWATNFGGIQEKTAAAATAIGAALSTVWARVQEAIGMFAEFLAPAIERLQEAFAAAGTQIEGIGPVLAGVGDAFAALWTAVQPILQALGGALLLIIDFGINALASAVENMSAIVTPILDQVGLVITSIATIVQEAFTLVAALVTGDWATAWQSAQDIMATFGAFVLSTWQNLYDFTAAIVATLWETVTGTLEDMGVDMQAIMDGIVAWWQTKWESLVEFVQPAIDAVNAVITALQNAWDWLQGHVFENPFEGWGAPPVGTGAGLPPAAVAPQGPPRAPDFAPPTRDDPRVPDRFTGQGVNWTWDGAEAGGAVVIQQMTIQQNLDWEEIRWRIDEMLARRGRR